MSNLSKDVVLKYVLIICALHSVGVFLGLLFLGPQQLTWFGFPHNECVFFQKQAGVFR